MSAQNDYTSSTFSTFFKQQYGACSWRHEFHTMTNPVVESSEMVRLLCQILMGKFDLPKDTSAYNEYWVGRMANLHRMLSQFTVYPRLAGLKCELNAKAAKELQVLVAAYAVAYSCGDAAWVMILLAMADGRTLQASDLPDWFRKMLAPQEIWPLIRAYTPGFTHAQRIAMLLECQREAPKPEADVDVEVESPVAAPVSVPSRRASFGSAEHRAVVAAAATTERPLRRSRAHTMDSQGSK